ncbi:transposase [Paracoccus bogoriensis]|uniref:transposase n=1 Tax=Paracoccus bogoriensis TaxID=242065 RepID=UPI001CA512D9|nr:transposase [Paracoccus bogoriensis]MBW7056209.1 transposase [Paracoccus bogoriensis]
MTIKRCSLSVASQIMSIPSRNAIENSAARILEDHPGDRLLRSLPGIEPVNALAMLAKAGDFQHLRNHRQSPKFWGNGPVPGAVRPFPQPQQGLELGSVCIHVTPLWGEF